MAETNEEYLDDRKQRLEYEEFLREIKEAQENADDKTGD